MKTSPAVRKANLRLGKRKAPTKRKSSPAIVPATAAMRREICHLGNACMPSPVKAGRRNPLRKDSMSSMCDAMRSTLGPPKRRNRVRMKAAAPEDVEIRLEFDQSKYVVNAIKGLMTEGLLGAALTGLMVLMFLRDWRSSLIVITTIPFALLAAVIWLWAAGQTINIMTLGGLALAVGVLVDEATVEIENIHTHM